MSEIENYKYVKAEIQNYKGWIKETDPGRLFRDMDALLKKANYKVLNYVEHHFPEQGYTCVWLLAESHLAIHTFPEDDATYLELSSCNPKKNEAFVELLEQWKQQNEIL
ncbi:MAG: S-adenosylmethionine decarboxylase [Marinifilaceae bacterium]